MSRTNSPIDPPADYLKKRASKKNSRRNANQQQDDNGNSRNHPRGSRNRQTTDRPQTSIARIAITVLVMIAFAENLAYMFWNMDDLDTLEANGVRPFGRSKARSKFSASRTGRRRNRRVVLLGPHDRYNDFADILSERILSKLLVDRAGFVFDNDDESKNTMLLGGIVTRDDMDRHGLTPHKTVYSMKEIQALSRNDFKNGPYDIVYTGGGSSGGGGGNRKGPSTPNRKDPVLYEKHSVAVKMLETETLSKQAIRDQVYDCSYLFPKELLVTKVNRTMGINTRVHATGSITTLPRPRKNYAIADSVEHRSTRASANSNKGKNKGPRTSCKQALASADYVRFRDKDPLAPDSSVMTKELYGHDIEELFEKEVRQELQEHESFDKDNDNYNYIAVQHGNVRHSTAEETYITDLAKGLDEVSRNTGNATVVFFSAGKIITTAALDDNDSFAKLCAAVMEEMTQPAFLYPAEHALKIVALISKARAVIGTSLHVRIVSFLYQLPRATLHGSMKHQRFLELWEAPDVASLGMVSNARDTWKRGLRRFFVDTTAGGSSRGRPSLITQNQTLAAYQSATRRYLDSFDQWSHLLITPSEGGEDDDDDHFNP